MSKQGSSPIFQATGDAFADIKRLMSECVIESEKKDGADVFGFEIGKNPLTDPSDKIVCKLSVSKTEGVFLYINGEKDKSSLDGEKAVFARLADLIGYEIVRGSDRDLSVEEGLGNVPMSAGSDYADADVVLSSPVRGGDVPPEGMVFHKSPLTPEEKVQIEAGIGGAKRPIYKMPRKSRQEAAVDGSVRRDAYNHLSPLSAVDTGLDSPRPRVLTTSESSYGGNPLGTVAQGTDGSYSEPKTEADQGYSVPRDQGPDRQRSAAAAHPAGELYDEPKSGALRSDPDYEDIEPAPDSTTARLYEEPVPIHKNPPGAGASFKEVVGAPKGQSVVDDALYSEPKPGVAPDRKRMLLISEAIAGYIASDLGIKTKSDEVSKIGRLNFMKRRTKRLLKAEIENLKGKKSEYVSRIESGYSDKIDKSFCEFAAALEKSINNSSVLFIDYKRVDRGQVFKRSKDVDDQKKNVSQSFEELLTELKILDPESQYSAIIPVNLIILSKFAIISSGDRIIKDSLSEKFGIVKGQEVSTVSQAKRIVGAFNKKEAWAAVNVGAPSADDGASATSQLYSSVLPRALRGKSGSGAGDQSAYEDVDDPARAPKRPAALKPKRLLGGDVSQGFSRK